MSQGSASQGKLPNVREDLQMLSGYHSPQVDVAVRLNTNESPAAPPSGFREAVAEAVAHVAWHRYPDRSATALRSAIAAQIAGEATSGGLEASLGVENIFAANGSNEVLQTLMLAYGGPARKVATFEPTYALHRHIANIVGTPVVSGERDSAFQLDLAHARDVVLREKPTITFLCSPNNPTGIVESREIVAGVLDAVVDVGGMLVVDEAYAEFSPWSALEMFGEDVPLVVSRTFSKTWAMAAARLGYLIGPAEIVEKLHAVVLPYHLDAVKQAAGTAALQFQDAMHERIQMIVSEREKLTSEMQRLGVEVWASGSNFILFRPAPLDGNDVWQQLLERGVLVRNCASWERLDGTLRITVGTAEENVAFIAALSEILETS